jgi:hypothetical protein
MRLGCLRLVDALRPQHRVANFLHHKVTRKPIGCLNDDGLGPVGLKGFQHRRETRSSVDRIGALHGLVVVGAHQHDARAFAVSLDCLKPSDSYMREFLRQTSASLAASAYDVSKLAAVLEAVVQECSAVAVEAVARGTS